MTDGKVSGGSSHADAAPSWLSAASYWQPARIVTSAWLEHAPFAFWLMDELRPRSVVELGSHWGFSFFVFAEAVRRLDIGADVYALDSWKGDDQAGFYGDEVHDSVRTISERDYPGFTHLLRGYFSDSRPLIADRSVDVLHIDGRHGYDDVKEDYELWRSAVREGGVILFHDIAERGNGFGVWRLWDDLSSQHPSFSFTHSHGLGVLAVGAVSAKGLAAFFDADAATVAEIRSTYERLGAVISRQAELEALPAEVDSLHVVVDSLTTEIERLNVETGHLNGEVSRLQVVIDEYRSSTSWKVTRPLRAVGALLRRLRNPRTRA